MNTLGKALKITSIGESHGNLIGIVLDGCPAGLPLDLEKLQTDLCRRRPGQSDITSTRNEQDQAEVLTGVYNGITTGAPITIIIKNKDVDSSKYLKTKWVPRPGHADLTAELKYGGYQDTRGGGRFSGRITAGFVMAGSIAKQLLEILETRIVGYTQQVGRITTTKIEKFENIELNPVRCPDPESAEAMLLEIKNTRERGDSIGGKVRCIAINPPKGIGEPVFDTLEGDLAKAFFSIPAVKAVEFGAGTGFAEMRGSESNDQYIIKDGEIKTITNNCGGILGGISNGMPIMVTITFKPTPSISMKQQTVNMNTGKETVLQVDGRHDPCIVPRAVPVVEAMMAIVLADLSIYSGKIPRILGN